MNEVNTIPAMRTCGICGAANIPRGVNWPWWTDGKPVHLLCQADVRHAVPSGFGSRQLVPGVSVDRIDVAAGLRELALCSYHEPRTVMVIEHALMRWARGEEQAAQRLALDRTFHGIDGTSWIRVVAAARAAAEGKGA